MFLGNFQSGKKYFKWKYSWLYTQTFLKYDFTFRNNLGVLHIISLMTLKCILSEDHSCTQ